MTMRDRIRALAEHLREDRAENQPSTPRERVVYIIEVWAALGLFFRATCHAVLYSLRYEDEDVHPLTMEYGWTTGLAVERDATDREPRHDDARDIQLATGAFSALLVLGTISYITIPPVVALALGPSVAVCVGDPFLGIYHDLSTANSQPTDPQPTD